MAEETKAASKADERTRGLRTLVIGSMFGVFLAIVVFVIGTYFFVVPRLLEHDLRLHQLERAAAPAAEDEGEEIEEAAVTPTDDAAPADEAAPADGAPPAEGAAPAAAAVPAMAPAATDAGTP